MGQLREIQDSANQRNLRVHFGLGDAATIDNLRIEWASGIVQEMHNVEVDQFLSINETRTKP